MASPTSARACSRSRYRARRGPPLAAAAWRLGHARWPSRSVVLVASYESALVTGGVLRSGRPGVRAPRPRTRPPRSAPSPSPTALSMVVAVGGALHREGIDERVVVPLLHGVRRPVAVLRRVRRGAPAPAALVGRDPEERRWTSCRASAQQRHRLAAPVDGDARRRRSRPAAARRWQARSPFVFLWAPLDPRARARPRSPTRLLASPPGSSSSRWCSSPRWRSRTSRGVARWTCSVDAFRTEVDRASRHRPRGRGPAADRRLVVLGLDEQLAVARRQRERGRRDPRRPSPSFTPFPPARRATSSATSTRGGSADWPATCVW